MQDYERVQDPVLKVWLFLRDKFLSPTSPPIKTDPIKISKEEEEEIKEGDLASGWSV